ncbi:hypothetical protein [Dactylosporangium matsuzakiense]|uniref:hypothetical protein n=1 Tax=Dactylosporangium matsuzakiense TaxID=53360 RepID=UPI0021C4090A|nr:hypothetical protein [Dactylosporangium matsuzakiense]
MTTPVVRKRPRDVWTASILLCFYGLLGVLLGLLVIGLLADGDDIPGFLTALFYANVVLAAAEIAAGAFVFIGREWGRRLAVGVCVLNGLGGIASLGAGVVLQALVAILVNLAIVVTLHKPEVKQWCRPG